VTPLEAIVQAMLATQEAQRAQLEVLLLAVQQLAPPPPAAARDALATCPTCGASGETQQAVRTMSGVTNVFCRSCNQKRVVGGPSTE
jgi:hypothetical protein